MDSKLRWGLLAAGAIAHKFAQGVQGSQFGRLQAVASRSREKAEDFAGTYSIPTAHGSYAELLADPDIDAVYISTPHPHHAKWAIKAAEAGKHILCEKPLTMNYPQAMAVAEAAVQNKVLLMEAFMYRCHPQTKKLAELVKEGAVGDVRLIRATFSFHAGYNPEGRLFCNALGGGGILDVGCYPISISRLIAGAAHGKPFLNPISVEGEGTFVETGVDGIAIANLRFEGDILAQVSTGVQLSQDNEVLIFGSKGHIRVASPWFCAGPIEVFRDGNREAIEIDAAGLYSIEADTVAEALRNSKIEAAAMPVADTLGNMQTLDRWRQAIGLTYEAEVFGFNIPTVSGRPLAKRSDNRMKYGRVPGVQRPVSRLVMGCDNQQTPSQAMVMFDDFFERGGNTFDTAWIYGGGVQERLLGNWIRQRAIRDDVNVIVKGAHTPDCYPDKITSQLTESLDRLQTDRADIYFMHRDNPDVPVSEFVDVLNGHVQEGRIRVFGGSNWSIARLDEANEYAASKGIQGFEVVSNNFSLARMVDPVWANCVAASEPEQKAWFETTQTSLFAWSSQARGFFTNRAGRDRLDDAELVRCWYSEENFGRRERAIELARRKAVSPINIALAYVLAQPFPTYALVGPRTLHETTTTLPGLAIELTPEEVSWLEQG